MEVIKEEKKEIKCHFCGETSNETDLITRTETTDRYIGVDWGVHSWEEDVIGMCPYCRGSLMVNNRKIEYRLSTIKLIDLAKEDVSKIQLFSCEGYNKNK